MQLRLACNSPLHFEPPLPPSPSHTLLSGKMQLLSQLLPRLLPQHKTLIFSQFTRQLDLLEDWAEVLHPEWGICRIDGSVAAAERAAQIHAFNTHPDHCLFLLSTRAGGLGINLTAADTVVLFDSDWNPQQDLQAQDRAHRIGQTRPVIVYRLATRGTVEQMLLERADGKRRLEKLVMQRDKFRGFSSSSSSSAPKGNDAMAELRRLLAGEDFEKYDLKGEEGVLTQQDLHVLTDRSEEAFQRAAEMGTAEDADGGAGAGTGAGAGVGGEGRDDGKFKSVVGKKGGEGDVLAGLV